MTARKLAFFTILFLSVSIYSYSQTPENNNSLDTHQIEKISKKIGFQVQEESLEQYLPLYTEAIKWLGVRYKRSGMGANGMDCSGLTSVIYKNVFDKKLVRSSIDMSKSIDQEIDKKDLQPGDLVFFKTRNRSRINHVGVFLGGEKFVHASCGKGVIISSLNEPYYKRAWSKGGRMILDAIESIAK